MTDAIEAPAETAMSIRAKKRPSRGRVAELQKIARVLVSPPSEEAAGVHPASTPRAEEVWERARATCR